MPSTLELRWTFEPPTLFEEDFSTNYREAEVRVAEGTVIALLPTDGDEARPPLRPEIEQYVEALFFGAQLVEHSSWSCSGPSVCVVRANGTRNLFIEVRPGVVHFQGGRADIRLTHADGTVIDTRRPN